MKSRNTALRSVRRRSGTVLLVAMASIVVVTAIAGAVAASTLRTRQSRKTERDMVQLELLCDAGILRARQQIAKNPSYTGEEWQLDSASLGNGEWSIAIAIDPDPSANSDRIDGRAVQVQARIAGRNRAPDSIQRTVTLPISKIQP